MEGRHETMARSLGANGIVVTTVLRFSCQGDTCGDLGLLVWLQQYFRSEVSELFLYRSSSKYFQVCGPLVRVTTTLSCTTKAAIKTRRRQVSVAVCQESVTHGK